MLFLNSASNMNSCCLWLLSVPLMFASAAQSTGGDLYRHVHGCATLDHDVTSEQARLTSMTTATKGECVLRCKRNPECGSFEYDVTNKTCVHLSVNYPTCNEESGSWIKVIVCSSFLFSKIAMQSCSSFRVWQCHHAILSRTFSRVTVQLFSV